MPSRRTIIQQGAILASTALLPRCLSAQQAPAPTLAKTPLGTLRGESANGVRVFRGVPYAEPPIGPLRFRPAASKRPWLGVRDATSFAASPIQTGEPGVEHSEDCLYLNLWTPAPGAAHGNGPWPVFVWIHGGGFTNGHAFEPVYDGSQFAREGVVVVSVGYRLGIFGFLDFEPLLGPAYAGTANNALTDLLTALDWLQHNIAAFGGDPTRITVGGESAGAKLTDVLLGTPRAQSLFAQAVSESGGAERVWSQADAGAVAQGFGKLWHDDTQTPVASMRDAPRRRAARRADQVHPSVAAALPPAPAGRRPPSAAPPHPNHPHHTARQASAHRHQPRRERALPRPAPGARPHRAGPRQHPTPSLRRSLRQVRRALSGDERRPAPHPRGHGRRILDSQ